MSSLAAGVAAALSNCAASDAPAVGPRMHVRSGVLRLELGGARRILGTCRHVGAPPACARLAPAAIDLVASAPMETRTHLRTCPLCEAMCGLVVQTDGDRVTAVR